MCAPPLPVGHPDMLLAIDPGLDTGWALYGADRTLAACGLGAPPAFAGVENVIIEHPFVYPRGRTKNPNSIVKLAVNAGEWSGRWQERGARVRFVLPRDWKGTIDADVCCARTRAKLTDAEREHVTLVERQVRLKIHNVLDAIGLGLYAVGRWDR